MHIVKLHDLYSSPNIIQGSKLRRIRCAGYVAYMGREVLALFLWGNLTKRTTWKTLEQFIYHIIKMCF
jgi:hypothetical protein